LVEKGVGRGKWSQIEENKTPVCYTGRVYGGIPTQIISKSSKASDVRTEEDAKSLKLRVSTQLIEQQKHKAPRDGGFVLDGKEEKKKEEGAMEE